MLYKAKNPHGGDIYEGGIRLDFSANTNPMGMPESVKQAAVSSLEYADRYPDPYARELISAISTYHGVPEDYVLAGAGAAEMIYSYCQEGGFKKALMTAPTFSEYGLALETTGCEIIWHYLKEDDGFTLDDGIISHIREAGPDAVFICNPNNPTGKLADHELMLEIIGVTEDLGARLFVDECFVELARGRSLTEFLGSCSNLTILRAFTKNYGMAGLRLGYVLSSDSEYLKGMSERVQPWNISTPAQAAGVAALKEKDFLSESIELIKRERIRLQKGLKDLGLKSVDSDVNFILFKGPDDLYDRMKEQGILIRNCDNYEGLGTGWYRIAVKLPDENTELLRTMEEVLGKE